MADRIVNVERLPRTVSLERDGDAFVLVYVDQQRLPGELSFVRTQDWREVVNDIKHLRVRGAPALGVAGAAAFALWANATSRSLPDSVFDGDAEGIADLIAGARPTAVNLEWGVRRAVDLARGERERGASAVEAADALFDFVKRMEAEDEAVNRAIGRNGSDLLAPGTRVLTHCNAGSLATVFFGTALGIVYDAAERGLIERVYADETRPVNQGARMTAWELARAGVPATLICDDMAASLMASGRVDCVIVGADRIARNGDVANKIGTYGLAVLARHHGIPFYVAAPSSTFDTAIANGDDIPIEQRSAREVIDPVFPGLDVWNPAFDVTPAELVTAIVTEIGVFDPSAAAEAVARS